MKSIFNILIMLIVLSTFLYNEDNVKSTQQVTVSTEAINDLWVDANQMNGVFRNNGIWYFDAQIGTWGLEWPKNSGLSPMFAAGQWMGAKFPDQTIRVAGVQHSATEFQPGEIDSNGVAINPMDPAYIWYELNSDGSGNWGDWPVNQGAPLDDNGYPLLIGDQTIFSVWNDLAPHVHFGSDKLSAEVRQLVFAFDSSNALGDMQFIKWQLVNKSGQNWDSTYFTIWTDPDLGDAHDDLVGCDTTLGLGYCYNASNVDQDYGVAPPAIGIDFLQGPIIDNPDSTVMLPDSTILTGKQMLRMTAFMTYDNNDSPQGNPTDGSDVWNYFRAYWRDGTKITYGERGANPANPPTNYMFPGDPETEQGAGWIDYNENDRRFIMTSGPFNMPPWQDQNGNDLPDFGEPGVQEIIACVMVTRGTDNLNSVTQLKQIDLKAEQVYRNNFYIEPEPLPTTYIWLDANRFSGIFQNNGIWHYDVENNTQGTEWPTGSGQSPMFAAGQWIGSKFNNDTIRVAGVQHSQTEYQPGEILAPFVPADPNDINYRWYELYPNGIGDWNNWPINQGAPVDENGNPLLMGDQTTFSVWNDLAAHNLYGTHQLSVEVHQTAYAFDRSDESGDMQYIKWQLVNKSAVDWDSTYFAIWTDPDVGDASDDLVGCDSILSLGYCYNATNNDMTYGTAPPAIGVKFLQGPIVDNPDSTLILPDSTILPGKEMLGMSAFITYDNNATPQGNPDNGMDIWNYFRAYWRDDTKITYGDRGTNPANPPTNYMFSGDPETATGWLDYNPDDRRFVMITGPFDLPAWQDTNSNGLSDFGEPGVQEILVHVAVTRGTNNLNSVTKLKQIYNFTAFKETIEIPVKYTLQQNYPNPFNPSTTVSYSISHQDLVKLNVFDIRGRKVKSIVNENKKAGSYVVSFDASDLATGVYFYQLKVGDKFLKTKKMILLR